MRASLAPGDVVLDRYRIEEAIASGGHSMVFRGEDTRLARPVCVKLFAPLLDLDEHGHPIAHGGTGAARTSYQHFVQEAFALSRLSHPNTLRIYDFGHLEGEGGTEVPVQVSEFCAGGTVTDLVRTRGPQPIDEVSRIVLPLCEALAEAHAAGLVHRDIKPHNLLFAIAGEARLPKLADFGIAKWADAAAAHDRARADDTSLVAGRRLAMYSPSWAAPEQMAGEPAAAAADQYSLALVTVYLATGLVLFADADLVESYRRRRHGRELAQAALAEAGAPSALAAALGRALAVVPGDRYVDISALAHAIRAAAEGPVRAPLAAGTEVGADREPSGVIVTPALPPVRIDRRADGTLVAGRTLRLLPLEGEHCEIDLGQGARLRLSPAPDVGGPPRWHLRARGAFIAPTGGRPSGAMLVGDEGGFEVISASRVALARGSVHVARLDERGAPTYALDGCRLVVDTDGDSSLIPWVLIDLGVGSEAHLICAPVPVPSRTGARRTPRGIR